MMLAVADYAEAKDGTNPEIPPLLDLAFQCEGWHALPEPGAVLDQPAGLLKKMTVALNIYHACRRYKRCEPGKEGDFARDFPDDWKIVMDIMALRRKERERGRTK